MVVNTRRFGSLTIMIAMVLSLLGACGGSAGVAAASPEDRVKSFMNDMMTALSDPNLKEPAKQEEWADKISKYALPTEQAKKKDELKQTLAEMGANMAAKPDLKLTMKVEGLTTEKVSETGDSAEVKITGGKMITTMGDEKKEIDMTKDPRNQKLKKVDGVWYILDEQSSN